MQLTCLLGYKRWSRWTALSLSSTPPFINPLVVFVLVCYASGLHVFQAAGAQPKHLNPAEPESGTWTRESCCTWSWARAHGDLFHLYLWVKSPEVQCHLRQKCNVKIGLQRAFFIAGPLNVFSNYVGFHRHCWLPAKFPGMFRYPLVCQYDTGIQGGTTVLCFRVSCPQFLYFWFCLHTRNWLMHPLSTSLMLRRALDA